MRSFCPPLILHYFENSLETPYRSLGIFGNILQLIFYNFCNPSETEGNGSHFGRVNQITGTPQDDDPVKVAAKQDYKSFLQQQIEERAKLKAEQKEKERLEDEKEVS